MITIRIPTMVKTSSLVGFWFLGRSRWTGGELGARLSRPAESLKEPCSATVTSPDQLSYPFGKDETTGSGSVPGASRSHPLRSSESVRGSATRRRRWGRCLDRGGNELYPLTLADQAAWAVGRRAEGGDLHLATGALEMGHRDLPRSSRRLPTRPQQRRVAVQAA
jgi:hypothetical protein